MQVKRRPGFTLIELLVVVAIIALLISILIPSLQSAREQGKRARCLANMKQIATAMHTYSSDDSRNISFPVQPVYGNAAMPLSQPEWLYISWWTWGGADGRVPWALSVGGAPNYWTRAFNDSVPATPQAGATATSQLWSAAHRPLNRTLYPRGVTLDQRDRFDMEIFHCPSDNGYPLANAAMGEVVDDNVITKTPLYDGLGNSYRGSFYGSYTSPRRGTTLGPSAHRLDTIPSMGDTIWFADSLFFNQLGANGAVVNPGVLRWVGWHKKRSADNVAFVDGSSRFQEVGDKTAFDSATLTRMGVQGTIAARGPNWRLDVYPTGGAVTVKPTDPRQQAFAGDAALWPKRGFQMNFDFSN